MSETETDLRREKAELCKRKTEIATWLANKNQTTDLIDGVRYEGVQRRMSSKEYHEKRAKLILEMRDIDKRLTDLKEEFRLMSEAQAAAKGLTLNHIQRCLEAIMDKLEIDRADI